MEINEDKMDPVVHHWAMKAAQQSSPKEDVPDISKDHMDPVVHHWAMKAAQHEEDNVVSQALAMRTGDILSLVSL
jgi:hypothetical protein